MPWTPAEIATLMTAMSAALVLVLKTLFGGAQQSRCTSVCWGCCVREPLPTTAESPEPVTDTGK